MLNTHVKMAPAVEGGDQRDGHKSVEVAVAVEAAEKPSEEEVQ